jgi:hypothetical protein
LEPTAREAAAPAPSTEMQTARLARFGHGFNRRPLPRFAMSVHNRPCRWHRPQHLPPRTDARQDKFMNFALYDAGKLAKMAECVGDVGRGARYGSAAVKKADLTGAIDATKKFISFVIRRETDPQTALDKFATELHVFEQAIIRLRADLQQAKEENDGSNIVTTGVAILNLYADPALLRGMPSIEDRLRLSEGQKRSTC